MTVEQPARQFVVSETIHLGSIGTLYRGTILESKTPSSFQVASRPEAAASDQITAESGQFTLDPYIVTALLFELDVVGV